ncbi:MAG: lipoyl(octanoyl) transferase LipB [Pseudomonadota bacterium]
MNTAATAFTVKVRRLGSVAYEPTFQAMKDFTENRDEDTNDEIWLLQHPQVFTQGLSGKREHLLNPGSIPVVQVDRGGQVTYHGPGQWVAYLLIDLRRRKLGVRQLVTLIEESIVTLLANHDIAAAPDADAPGVYVAGRKIASLGLRIRRGCSYHGLALNVAMDLEPFTRINPCGYAGLEVTSMAQLLGERSPDLETVGEELLANLLASFETQLARADP